MSAQLSNSQESIVPQHIAIIMDGNGRWAQKRGLPRTEGHRAGAEKLKEIVEGCLEIGVRYLTVYAFSKENWKRPKAEVAAIMKLSEFFFRREFNRLRREGVTLVHIGDKAGLPHSLIKVLDNIEKRRIDQPRLYLNIAFNYSGRSELVEAFKRMGESVLHGELNLTEITENNIRRYLYTSEMPDPDLLIRTGGENRVSNFLLWQIAYTELWTTDTLWPDFSIDLLLTAIEEFRKRIRRFGGL